MDSKSTLYRTIKRMIERGNTGGMEEKLDIFMATNKLSLEDYNELLALLHGGSTVEETT